MIVEKERRMNMQVEFSQLTEFLPFLIPLIILEFGLLGYTLWHILTHKTYKRGNRALWLIVTIVGMNYVGPILYFILGKEDAKWICLNYPMYPNPLAKDRL